MRIRMNFVKPKDTPAFLKAVKLQVFPMGLDLGIGGEAQGPHFYKKEQKGKKKIKGWEKPFDSLVLQSESYSSKVVWDIC